MSRADMPLISHINPSPGAPPMSDNQDHNCNQNHNVEQEGQELPKTLSLTQQSAFRKDRRALISARKKGFTDRDIINKMADAHSHPDSPEAIIESAGAVLHLRANMRKESPIADAYKALCAEEAFKSGTNMREGADMDSETEDMPPCPA